MSTQTVGIAREKERGRFGGVAAVVGLGLALAIALIALMVFRPAREGASLF